MFHPFNRLSTVERVRARILRWGRHSGCNAQVWRLFEEGERHSVFLPLPVRRERVGVRVFSSTAEDPHPNPLPEYRERGPDAATLRSTPAIHSFLSVRVASVGHSCPAERTRMVGRDMHSPQRRLLAAAKKYAIFRRLSCSGKKGICMVRMVFILFFSCISIVMLSAFLIWYLMKRPRMEESVQRKCSRCDENQNQANAKFCRQCGKKF